MTPAVAAARRLVLAQCLTWLVIALAAVAAGVGLLIPSVYRETDWVVPQNRGQDLVTLVALVWLRAHAGGRAARLAATPSRISTACWWWLGLVSYLAYAYTGAAFAYGVVFIS